MAFMEPFTYSGEYFVVESNHGERTFLPIEIEPGAKVNSDLADYVEGTIDEPEEPVTIESGILGRLSAPGYMDCTPWSPYDSEDEALADLQEDEPCETCGEPIDEDGTCETCRTAEEDSQPQEEDLITEDYRRFWAHGMSRPAPELEIREREDGLFVVQARNRSNPADGKTFDSMESALSAYMDGDRYWPNVWSLSDHGNWSLIELKPKG